MARRTVFKSRNKGNDSKVAYLFLIPWLVGFLVFVFYPLIMTVVYSFSTVTTTVNEISVVNNGIVNYSNALFSNLDFVMNMGAFIGMEISFVPVILIISFIIALVLNGELKGKTIFRTIFFLPVIIISGTLIQKIFPDAIELGNGQVVEQVSTIEQSFIYHMVASFSDVFADIVKYIYDNFVIILWFTGIPIVLFINGLQKINKNLYEAAQIDGATKWQILWKVMIPNVRGLAAVIAVFSIVQLSIMPTSPVYDMIRSSISGGAYATKNVGLGSAMAVMYGLLILVLVVISYLILIPKEPKVKEVITKTQNEQLKITLARMGKGAAR